MKNFYALIVALFMVSGAMAQWFEQNSGTIKALTSVYFSDTNNGYIAGDSGTILKTSDGGTNWMLQNSGTNLKLLSVFSPDVLTCYVLCESDTFLKTTDGGINWFKLPFGTSKHIHSLWFTDALTGFAVGDSGTILKTTDGGTNWISKNSGTIKYLRSVQFPSIDTGYIVGYFGTIIKTIDGGENWFPQNSGTDIILSSVYFPNENSGYVRCGYWEISTPFPIWHQLLYKTTDGGTTWNWLCTWENYFCYSLYFTDPNNGYLCGQDFFGRSLIMHTNDGGIDWEEEYIDSVSSLNSICFPRFDTGYTVGVGQNGKVYYGAILKTTNGGAVGIDRPSDQLKLLPIYPNPTLTQITIETPSAGILSILSINGQQLLQKKITESSTSIDVSGWKSGVYFIRVMCKRKVQVGKFVKQ